MITLEAVAPQTALIFKTIRLRALQDSPHAFSSTYAKESQLSDAEWVERATRWNGEKSILYLAMEEASACGIVGASIDESDPTRAQVISMWTAPTHRQRGIGRLLVNQIRFWGRDRGVRTLLLLVTSINEPAMRFYQCLGFTQTGRTEPYPNDPTVLEYEMSMPTGIAPGGAHRL